MPQTNGAHTNNVVHAQLASLAPHAPQCHAHAGKNGRTQVYQRHKAPPAGAPPIAQLQARSSGASGAMRGRKRHFRPGASA